MSGYVALIIIISIVSLYHAFISILNVMFPNDLSKNDLIENELERLHNEIGLDQVYIQNEITRLNNALIEL